MAQTIAPCIELIISADTPARLKEINGFVSARHKFAKTLFLLHAEKNLARARILSAADASADILAVGEDHCFVQPNWAEELLSAFDCSGETIGAAP